MVTCMCQERGTNALHTVQLMSPQQSATVSGRLLRSRFRHRQSFTNYIPHVVACCLYQAVDVPHSPSGILSRRTRCLEVDSRAT